MSTITREQLRERAREKVRILEFAVTQTAFADMRAEFEEELELARIALASIEAEVVAYADPQAFRNFQSEAARREWMWRNPGEDLIPLFTAPPAPKCLTRPVHPRISSEELDDETLDELIDFRRSTFEYNSQQGNKVQTIIHGVTLTAMLELRERRAAMLQGSDNEQQRKASIHDALCEKYNVESLADFVDWQRNHIAELEAAPPAPVGPGETAVMPDYPGYVLTQRECYQAGKKAGLAEAGKSPVIPDGGEHGFCHKHPDTRLLTHPYIQLMTYPPRPAIYCPKCDPNVTEWVEMDKKLMIDN